MIAQSPPPVTIGDLLLEVSRAEFNEGLHQRHCRTRAAGDECRACLDYEATWLAADQAVADFMFVLTDEWVEGRAS